MSSTVATNATTSFTPQFSAGGLISGLDTNGMVDKLTSLQALPLTSLRIQQTALKTQVSTLGSLASAVNALGTLASSLSSTGVISATATTSSAAFTATAGAGANNGSYSLQVTALASAAKQRTQAFASAMSPVTGGTLAISAGGTSASVTLTDGMQLADVAKAINGAGLRVSAAVLTTGTNAYLSITALDTGYDPAGTSASALSIVETSTGTQGQPLSASTTSAATNAQFSLDGLAFSRRTNSVSDALAGVTLNLLARSSAAESLQVSTNPAGSQTNLQTFVDAYNGLVTRLNAQIAPPSGSDPNSSLVGDETARDLQAQLQALTSSASGSGSIRSLADIGVKTNFQDGTLSIDAAAFSSALNANPQGLKDLFSAPGTGVGAQVAALTKRFTNPLSGSLTARTEGLNESIRNIDDELVRMQEQVTAFHDGLLAKFAAMESILSSLKSQATYLTAIFTTTGAGANK